MKHLVDTTFVIDLLRRRPHAEALLPTLLNEGFAITIFTHMELWEGTYTSRDPKRAELGLRSFLRGVQVLPFSRRVSLRAARLRGELRRLKRPLEQRAIDILIAATAWEAGLIIVTSDTDYDDIPGLVLLDPREA